MRLRLSRLAPPLTAFCLLAGVSPGEGVFHHAKPPARLQGHERVLHALNRFTFGATPGQARGMDQAGLNRWFEQQLHPQAIDDAALDAHLASFPALRLPSAELLTRYPAPNIIRQMTDGKLPLPSDPRLRTVAADQIAFHQLKKEDKGEKPAGDGKAELSHLTAVAPVERLDAILAMPAADFAAFRQSLHGPEVQTLETGMPPQDRETFESLNGSERMITAEVEQSRLERDLYSNRQLEAVMIDFWLNHFNIYVHKNEEEPFYLAAYERDTIRPRALGNFEDLLVATAQSPAMLEYLDNAGSIGPGSQAAGRPNQKQSARGLNENYARELMELHTLGVGGGYTQADVTQVARVFTGWTVDKQTGAFLFNPKKHEPGPKVVLGQTIPEGGMQEGLTVLHMLATSPATAHFIAQKLAIRFVSDDPPRPLVDRMAQTFLKSHGDLKAVLRTLWKSPEFWTAGVYRAKVKTPEEFVLSAVRASGAEVSDPQQLVQAIAKLGQPLYGMQTPNGYSWKQDDWVGAGALVSRMNFSLVLAGDRIAGVHPEWARLLAQPPSGPVAVSSAPQGANVKAPQANVEAQQLESLLLGQPASDRTLQAVEAQASNQAAMDQAATSFPLGRGAKKAGASQPRAPEDAQASVMAGLFLGSPEFQRR